MSNFLISNEIKMMLTASKFLHLINNQRRRSDILSVKFIPPVLGSDSLGNYKVTLKYEPKQKFKLTSSVE
jgi:hypothetical protein